MLIRRRKSSVESNDALFPKFSEFNESGIQDVIKSKITKEQMVDFLNKKINEDTIMDYKKLLELREGIYIIPNEDPSDAKKNNNKKKYLFDLIIVILYEELLTFSEVTSIVNNEGFFSSLSLFEKMVMLEYGLFYLTYPITVQTGSFGEKIYIADNLVNIYYKDDQRTSYKDLDNVESELSAIYDSISLPKGYLTSITDPVFSSKTLVRINNSVSDVEGLNQSKYSFLLNYNNFQETVGGVTTSYFDQIFIRKFYAIKEIPGETGRTYGYYIKSGERIYFTGLSGYSYYGLLSDTYSSSYKQARDFLISLWENIAQRTINY